MIVIVPDTSPLIHRSNHEAVAMKSITPTIHPALLRYSRGEISIGSAANLLGPDATIHDVIAQMRILGLEPPPPDWAREERNLAKARRALGLTR
jgi:hypothetical protein